MQKDYRNWHTKKRQVNDIEQRPFFHEREIWFCHLGENVGSEQDGKGEDFLRPIVIIRKFNKEIFWAVPLTKSKKQVTGTKAKYYFEFSFKKDVTSVAILSQIRLVDARRLDYTVGKIKEEGFKKLKEKLKELLP